MFLKENEGISSLSVEKLPCAGRGGRSWGIKDPRAVVTAPGSSASSSTVCVSTEGHVSAPRLNKVGRTTVSWQQWARGICGV